MRENGKMFPELQSVVMKFPVFVPQRVQFFLKNGRFTIKEDKDKQRIITNHELELK